MDEKRWLSCTDLYRLSNALGKRRRSNLRKNRLFACACCRRIWHLLDEASRVGVALSELYADNLVNAKAMRAARDDIHRAMQAFNVQHGTLEECTGLEDENPYTYTVIHDPERRR